MLEVKALNQFYGGSHTLWDVDLAVSAGSRMCVMGRNGMGKTTLLKCIMGLQPARSGGILFDGFDLVKCAAEQRAVRGIGASAQSAVVWRATRWTIPMVAVRARARAVVVGSS